MNKEKLNYDAYLGRRREEKAQWENSKSWERPD